MAPFQVDKMTGKSPAAFQNPIKTNMRGEITEIVLSVPIFFEKNTFLVVHIPKNVVQDLIKSTAAQPESERAQFIRDWIKNNQQAIYEKYVASGGKTTHFDYEAAQIAAPTTLPKPTKVQPPPTVFQTTPEPPKRVIRLDGAVVTGEKPPAEKIALVSPPERRVIAIAPKIEIPPLPKGVLGGNGSDKLPYQIEVKSHRVSDGVGAGIFPCKFILRIEDVNIHVSTKLTLSQLKRDARSDTQQEVLRISEGIIHNYAAKNKREIDDNTAINGIRKQTQMAFSNIIDTLIKKYPETEKYLNSGN